MLLTPKAIIVHYSQADQSSSHPTMLRPIFILSSHLFLNLKWVLSDRLPCQNCVCILSPWFKLHSPSCLYSTDLIKLCVLYKSLGSSICNILHYLFTSLTPTSGNETSHLKYIWNDLKIYKWLTRNLTGYKVTLQPYMV